MKRVQQIFILIVSLICSQAFGGVDVDNALEQINNSAAFGISLFNLDYKESFFESDRQGGLLPKSTESGTIFGFTFDLRNAFWKRIYTDLYLDYYDGKLKYDGTDRDTYAPMLLKCWHKFVNANLKLGYVFTFFEDRSLQIIPYVGVGHRYWYRLYNTTSKERYYHYKALAGIKLDWLVTDKFIISPYIEGGKIFNAKMRWFGKTSPNLSYGQTFVLGKKPIYETGLELNYRIFDEFFINGVVSYSQFEYGRSNWKMPFEPDSKTHELKFGFGVRYSWLID